MTACVAASATASASIAAALLPALPLILAVPFASLILGYAPGGGGALLRLLELLRLRLFPVGTAFSSLGSAPDETPGPIPFVYEEGWVDDVLVVAVVVGARFEASPTWEATRRGSCWPDWKGVG